jgi:hypothetical protein
MGKRHTRDNRSNQMNPNNDSYWQARGWEERPDDWNERFRDGEELDEPNKRIWESQRSSNK